MRKAKEKIAKRQGKKDKTEEIEATESEISLSRGSDS
jgi:hypothetical protein